MHKPVFVNEVLEYLDPKTGQTFIDATLDGGGHALTILERISPGGKLLGIELDDGLLRQTEYRINDRGFSENAILVHDSYVNLKKIVRDNLLKEADGIFFDLGLSSWHLEVAGRGFSFQKDEPLDMRFDSSAINRGPTAEEILNTYSYDRLVDILKNYGEERFAKSIVARIIKVRKEKPFRTTFDLVEVIKNSVPFWYRRGRINFATRTFQAIRIAVNNELENIKSGLMQAAEALKSGGRLVVISFHSLEDRIVKNLFRELAGTGIALLVTKKPMLPTLEEITLNPRARSAKLRVIEKL